MEILLDTFKWSGAVGGAVLLLTVLKPALDRRYSARWRYGVWLAMAALLLLAPARWDALCLPAERPVVLEVPEMALSVSPQTGLNLRSSPAGGAGPAAGRLPALPLAEVLTALWLSGAALFLLYHLAGTWRFVHRARRWSLPAGAETALPVLALLVTAAAAGSVGVRAAAPEPVLEPIPEPVAESVPVRAPETAVPPEEDGRETGHGLPPTGVLGDYDGDGVRDTQIEINGRTYPLVWDSDMGEFEPLPGIDIPFSLTADYDGDSQPDSEVRINGQRWQITRNDDGTATYAQID